MTAVERFEQGHVILRWEPAIRLLRMSFLPEARPNAEDARSAQTWIDERAGEADFSILADLENADDATLLWRYRWLAWAFTHHRRIRAATLNLDRAGLAIVRTFARGTHVRFRHFATEADALSWLRSPAAVGTEPI